MREMRDTLMKKAFTLIELLVVVAIIALLAAILLPSLMAAKELAIKMNCNSRMRQISLAGFIFANDHDGRSVGVAVNTSGGYLSWHNILSKEIFNDFDRIPRFVANQGVFDKARKKCLWCPSQLSHYPDTNKYTNTTWHRIYLWNSDAQSSNTLAAADPASIDPSYTAYYYGAKLSLFKNPSRKVLIREAQAGTDTCTSNWPYTPPILGSPYYFTALSAHYAFRHRLKANIVFMDGHTETLLPGDQTINKQDRYNIAY